MQTLEGNPAFVHGGPFANIAHGCNSVIATRAALGLGDYVVTEAGFGADLGAEKFFDIKCRQSGLKPAAAVIVATVRALKMNGGVAKAGLAAPDVEAVRRGGVNLARHIENVRQFGVPAVVAINFFGTDTDAEIEVIRDIAASHGSEAVPVQHWADGGAGAEALAAKVADLCDHATPQFAPIYDDDLSLFEKINTVATRIYRAEEAIADPTCPGHSSSVGRMPGSAICRCAWPRPSTASRPTRPSWARRPAMSYRCAKCGWRRVPASWSRSAGRS